jgi:hypothetical protein
MDPAAAKSAEVPLDPPLGSKPPPKSNNIPVGGGAAHDENIQHDSQVLQQPPKIGSRSAKVNSKNQSKSPLEEITIPTDSRGNYLLACLLLFVIVC